MRDKGAKRPASWKLHIDDGCMGGGESILYDRDITESEFNTICQENFLENQGVLHPRKNVFRYCVMAENNWEDTTGAAVGGKTGYAFTIAKNWMLTTRMEAANFMHELGHGLGLRPEETGFNGIDSWDYPHYYSCMNYIFLLTTYPIDYSDGSNGIGDFNDWGFIKLNIKE
ncbi:MAG: hypothetical protein QCI82_09280 [Candidatus Thermoplasmatota archaeon]|nr:hypothetical protein [Candidatus Thermoplasmatota archaeon]